MFYCVDVGTLDSYPHCECVNWSRNKVLCKHLIGVAQYFSWSVLSNTYWDHPLNTLDDSCVSTPAIRPDSTMTEILDVSQFSQCETGIIRLSLPSLSIYLY